MDISKKGKLLTFRLEQNTVKSPGREYKRRATYKWRAEQCYDIQTDIKKTYDILKDQTSAKTGIYPPPKTNLVSAL